MPFSERAAAVPPASRLATILSPILGRPHSLGPGMIRGFILAPVAVAIAILAGHLLAGVAYLPNLAMIFVPAILYAALRYGFLSAFFASALSLLAYNFFFMEPFGAFGIRGMDDVLALAVFLAIGAITSDLANQVRRQTAAAHEREAHTSALYALKRAVDRADCAEHMAQAIVAQIEDRIGVAAALWEYEETTGDWHLLAASDPSLGKTRPKSSGRAQAPMADNSTLHTAMVVGGSTIGMLVTPCALDSSGRSSSMPLLQAMANEAGDALRQLRLTQELQAVRRAAETERLRAALLNSITHDFRTPLASILGATTTLMVPGASFTAEARDMLLSTIRNEALRLDRFVRNLLDMSRLEAGAVVPNPDWVDVVDIVASATQHIRRTATDVAVDIALPETLPMLRLDAVLTEHALVNLLDNAVKHSPPDGRIRIGARHAGSVVTLEVDDQGPGVPLAEREQIFEKFSKVPSGDRGRAGTGLGLSIARGFIEAQGGRVRVTDGPHGARFQMELPVPAPSDASLERSVQ